MSALYMKPITKDRAIQMNVLEVNAVQVIVLSMGQAPRATQVHRQCNDPLRLPSFPRK